MPEAMALTSTPPFCTRSFGRSGSTGIITDAGVVWQVDGTNREYRVLARALTQAVARRANRLRPGKCWAAGRLSSQTTVRSPEFESGVAQ